MNIPHIDPSTGRRIDPKTGRALSKYAQKQIDRLEGRRPPFEFKSRPVIITTAPPEADDGTPAAETVFRQEPSCPRSRKSHVVVGKVLRLAADQRDRNILARCDGPLTTVVINPERLGRPALHRMLRIGDEVTCEVERSPSGKSWYASAIISTRSI